MAVKKIDTGSFEEVISNLETAIDSFETVRTNLEKNTDSLIDDWSGDAKDAFEDAYDTLKLYMSCQYDMLEVMKKDLTSIKESYEGWDSELAKSFAETTP